MAYLLSEIMDVIETCFPKNLAMSFDNPGLMCGHSDQSVSRIMLSLDADNHTITRAVEAHVDALITHHPMIFNPVKSVSDQTPLGKKLLTLIEAKIPCYAMHTNFDIGIGGMGYAAARMLGLKEFEPLEITGEQGDTAVGVGFAATLDHRVTAKELAGKIKETFDLNGIWIYDAGKPIQRIAVCPGSGKGMMNEVIACHADAYITGDTGHHDGLDFKDAGISLIDAGHYGIEHIFAGVMETFLKERFPDLEIIREETDEREFI